MPTYIVDAERTRLAFAVRGLFPTRGEFAQIAGSVVTDEQNQFKSLEITFAASSLRTGLWPRDAHLKTAAFLDARRYPMVTFRSEHAAHIGPDRYEVPGMLRLHGREQAITLTVDLAHDDLAGGAQRAHVSGVLPRSAFAIPRNPLLRALMVPAIGDAVYISADVQVALAPDHIITAPRAS